MKIKLALLLFVFLFVQFTIGQEKIEKKEILYTNTQDWPNLNRFKEENKKIAPPEQGEDRIVFMGNSVTEGWLFHSPDFFAKNGYINRGIGGQTTPQMLLRFRSDVINLKANVVVILAGTNDIAGNTGWMTMEEIMNNFTSMVELAKANQIKVVLCSVLPAHDYSWRPGLNPDKKIPELNALLKTYASKEDVIYLDYFSAMVDDRNGLPLELAEDGVHPTKKGYDVMEPLVQEAIKKALK